MGACRGCGLNWLLKGNCSLVVLFNELRPQTESRQYCINYIMNRHRKEVKVCTLFVCSVTDSQIHFSCGLDDQVSLPSVQKCISFSSWL